MLFILYFNLVHVLYKHGREVMNMNITRDFKQANTYYNIMRKRRKVEKERREKIKEGLIIIGISLVAMIDWDKLF